MTRPHPSDGAPGDGDLRDPQAQPPAGQSPERPTGGEASAERDLGGEQQNGAAEAEPAEDVEALREELERTRQQHLRAVADYQNLLRRSREERAEQARLASKTLLINYLPVLDDLTRALSAVDDEIAGHRWVEGVRLVQQKFRQILEASGAREIEAEGRRFDPAVHEAIGSTPGPEGEVVAVAQPGWALDNIVIRPAMVIVGSGGGPPGDDPGGNTGGDPGGDAARGQPAGDAQADPPGAPSDAGDAVEQQ